MAGITTFTSRMTRTAAMLSRDRFALTSAVILLVVIGFALAGPLLLGQTASKMELKLRNLPPGTLGAGWLYVLGADTLGRSVLSRLIVGARNTLLIAVCAVLLSAAVGTILGTISGYKGGTVDNLIMRATDIVLSFPSLLLALVIIYLLGPSGSKIIIVLAVAGLPIYLRTARAQVLELRERMFVSAARAMGLASWRILLRHILPPLVPTMLTLATLEFSNVILTESALSFLGLGIQPPDFTWGAMVAAGRGYLATAWWISFWPGLMIMVTTLCLNIVSSWLRVLIDPQQRWRLEVQESA